MIEPVPPTTTTTKASPITLKSISRLAGSRATCSAPPRPARNDPEREHRGEQDRLIDAERADHLAILRRRPHQPAKPRLGQREMKNNENRRPHCHQEQVVARDPAAENFDSATKAGRARAEQILRTPDPAASDR